MKKPSDQGSTLCAACGTSLPGNASFCGNCGQEILLAGRYRLREKLAQGDDSVTYRATRESDGRVVCVKELRLSSGSTFDEEERFRRETQILRQLSHPGIPRYLDDFVSGSGAACSLCLVQEFVDGQSLAAEMASHRYTEAEVLETVEQLLDVLDYLHALSPPVIHRDIKPSNVMRRTNGEVALVDFGSVRDAFAEDEDPGGGTIGHMAPEQLSGEATPATDLYGLGVLAVVLLSRRPADTLLDPDDTLAWRKFIEVRPETEELLASLLERDPKKRAQRVAEVRPMVAAALRACREPPRPREEPAPKPARKVPLAAVAAVVALAATGAFVLVLRTQTPSEVQAPVGAGPRDAPVRIVEPVPLVEPPAPPSPKPKRRPGRRRRAAAPLPLPVPLPLPSPSPLPVPSPSPKPAQPPAPAPAPAPAPRAPPRALHFPDFLLSQRPMTRLQRDLARESFPGSLVDGSGTIDDVVRCSSSASSPRWGRSCLQVRLRSPGGRITLFYGLKDEATVSALNLRQEHTFARCVGIQTTPYSASCDMP
jgi:serine/threonine protein kinase